VDENGATVARSLVEIIVGEVARRREQKFGYTAEQITSKITQDSSTAAMMKHLLKDMHPHELERLLLTVLPKPYMDYVLRYDQERDSALDALPTCFRIAFDSASDEIKTQVARNFVRIVKEESGDYIRAYETAFFRGTDLAYLAQDEVNLVVDHILRRLQTGWALDADDYEKLIYGLGRFVPESEVYNFFEAIVTFVTRELLDDEQGVHTYYIFLISGEYQELPESSRLRFSRLLANQIRRYRAQGQSREEQALTKLESQLGPVPGDAANTSDLSPDDIPF